MLELINLLFNKESSSIFVPTVAGFKPLVHDVTKGSIIDVCEHLGYHPDQIKTYLGDLDNKYGIEFAILEVFTRNIVYVSTIEPQTFLSKGQVNKFLKGFDIRREYGDYTGEDILKTGIENRSLHINFLARVLNIENPALNGVFTVESIGYHLYFNDGYLSDYDPSDGLNMWGKLWKEVNPKMTADYESQAKIYWGDKVREVIREVNTQAEAFANTPDGFNNPFISKHRTKEGLVNFSMLLVCHYDAPIDFSEFAIINHGRYKEITRPDYEGLKSYQVGRFIYSFTPDGEFIAYYGA